MKILALSNLFPPHHAGTFDLRCQTITDLLRLRGHEMHVLTSNHGMQGEQRDADVDRRLWLSDAFGHERVESYGAIKELELHNHQVLKETIQEYSPEVVHVFSMEGLSKSLIFGLRNARVPAVYDVSDAWIATGIRTDPWLAWWNRPSGPFASNVSRATLEASGQRNRFDETAPTRMTRGYDRVPAVFGSETDLANVQPESITAFPFDNIYFCSQSLKSLTLACGFRVNHADVIVPGVSTQTYFGEVKPADAPFKKLLFVGRLIPESGVMTALEALAKLREKKLRLSLSIYGRGESDYISQLRSYVVQYQLPVEFLTVSNQNRDLAAVYRNHDALLYTVEWDDSLAMVALEAMACGSPVIGTTSGGAADILRHGETALTFEKRDSAELASRIEELATQPDLRSKIATAGQELVFTKCNETQALDKIEARLDESIRLWQASQ